MADYNVEELCERTGLPPAFFALCDKGANCITARELAKLDENDQEDLEYLSVYGIEPIYTQVFIIESKEIMKNGTHFLNK